MTSSSNSNEKSLREISPAYNVGGKVGAVDIDLLNRGYICPPDAGPAWRAAWEYGLDMSLLEESLQMTEEERLADHQQALNRILRFTTDDDASAKMTRICSNACERIKSSSSLSTGFAS